VTRIPDLLAAGPTRSFEFFPPKTEAGFRTLDATVEALSAYDPSFMSVTYGAGGSTRDTTRDLVIRMNSQRPFPTMAHLTCVGHTIAEVDDLLDTYAANGVDNILALGGDPPADGSPVTGDFTYAIDLIAHIRRHPHDFAVGVAAHPEVHPRSPDRASDRDHLAAKLELADFAVTNMIFSPEPFLQMRDELAERGVDKPILPGIMLFLQVAGVRRMATMNATTFPPGMADRLELLIDDPDGTVAYAVEQGIGLCQDLLTEGVPGLHLFALNKPEASIAVLEALAAR
jgi:methylenetetrahydrofolate reductase (NADPH)